MSFKVTYTHKERYNFRLDTKNLDRIDLAEETGMFCAKYADGAFKVELTDVNTSFQRFTYLHFSCRVLWGVTMVSSDNSKKIFSCSLPVQFLVYCNVSKILVDLKCVINIA